MARSSGIAASIAAAAAIAGCGDPPVEGSRADASDATKVALGARIYAEHCAACHGARLEGQPNWRQKLPNGRMPAPPHDESGHTWHHPDQVLFGITKYGLVPGKYAPPGYQSDMPGFGDKLSDDQIWATLSFIQSHWKTKRLLETRAEMIRNARR